MSAQEITVSEIDGVGAPIDIREALPRFEKAWNKTRDALFEMLELIRQYQDRPGFDRFCEELETPPLDAIENSNQTNIHLSKFENFRL